MTRFEPKNKNREITRVNYCRLHFFTSKIDQIKTIPKRKTNSVRVPDKFGIFPGYEKKKLDFKSSQNRNTQNKKRKQTKTIQHNKTIS